MKLLNPGFRIFYQLAYFLPCSPRFSRTRFMSHTFFLQAHPPPCGPCNNPGRLMPLYLAHIAQVTSVPLSCLENFQSSLKQLFYLFTISKNIFGPSSMLNTLLDLWYIELYTRMILPTNFMLYVAYQKRTHTRHMLYTQFFPIGRW